MINCKGIIFTIFVFGTALAAPPSSSSGNPSSKISPELRSLLEDGKRGNLFIEMSEGTSEILLKVSQTNFANRDQRLNTLYQLLVEHAEQTQKPVIDYLTSVETTFVSFKSFWIVNQIYVANASLSIVETLSQFPDISYIRVEEISAKIIEPEDVKIAGKRMNDEVEWGVERIQAPEAWQELKDFAETKIIVATLDTGVRGTHETLRDNWVGKYGWYDPTSEATLEPTDGMGHGTHTTATIAGQLGVGVAPWTKWMSCRGCKTMGCLASTLIACGQFLLCPTLTDGVSEPDCSKAPHLVSNSWSAGQNGNFFNGVIDAWHAAGIIPIFSIGNNGSYFCNSAQYPGEYNVISVGSTMKDESLSWFSSVGPSFHGNLKPEVVGPGSDIRSAFNTADDAYTLMSGTSFSCPHASGLVALLLTRNPNLTYEEVKNLIIKNTDKKLGSTGRICGGISDNVYPNYVFGNGRINALRSVRALAAQMEQRS